MDACVLSASSSVTLYLLERDSLSASLRLVRASATNTFTSSSASRSAVTDAVRFLFWSMRTPTGSSRRVSCLCFLVSSSSSARSPSSLSQAPSSSAVRWIVCRSESLDACTNAGSLTTSRAR